MGDISVWTVGHSNHSFDAFAGLLVAHDIQFVLDVRSYPQSRIAPQFNRDAFDAALASVGLGYLFLGAELGGRPSSESHYDDEGHALYGPMSREPAFEQAIERVLRGAASHRLALTCSERDPEGCHRRLLVGRVLCGRGVELRHILADGTLLRERDVNIAGSDQSRLFEDEAATWRSTQSVSHKRRLSTSSAG